MTKQIVFSKNKLFFYFLLFGYIFGVLLYNSSDVFKYVDETMALFLVLFAGIIVWERRNIKDLYPLLVIGGIFTFYIIYSFAINSNIPQAIIKDLLIQIKPYLGFFCVYLLAPRLTQKQKRFIIILCIIVGCLLLIIGAIDQIDFIFGHVSRFATAAIVTALLFLYCSSLSWSDIIVFIILLSIGFLSTRSKFYGFWSIAVLFIIYCKTGGKVKFNIKSTIVIGSIIAIALCLSWQKIMLYYINGSTSPGAMWSRPAMMVTSFLILKDYFPFGTGLASFGTLASAEHYSKTYEEYGLDNLWGVSKDKPDFITDAFYPGLAQFGIVGVILYWSFWIYLLKYVMRKQYSEQKQFLLTVLAFVFFTIEGFGDVTFTHNRGLFVLILMGMVLSDNAVEKKYI